MATDVLPPRAGFSADDAAPPLTVGDVVRVVFQPLASLKLTVSLLFLGILLVLFGTLAQDKMGMWEVVSHYFRSWIVWVELRMLLPDAWFPHRPAFIDQPLLGGGYLGFPFPGGLTIGLLMAGNLLAAHTVRFKVQTRGLRLWIGLGVIVLGILVTWLVIASGHSKEGIQGEPAIGWRNLWLLFKSAVVLGWVGTIGWLLAATMRQGRKWLDLVLPGAACVVLGIPALLMLLLGQKAYLGDSGMRILWQLIQASLAGVVLLVGCILVFKKRGPIVLIHAGIGLMMFNELFVGKYAVEERMRIPEGQTVNFVKDIRAVELAVIDPEGDKEHVVAVPLSANGRQTRFLRQRAIRHPQLPFDIEILRFYKNSSELRDLKQGEEPLATAGIGRTMTVDPQRPVSAADREGSVNMAAAVIKLTSKEDGKDLGTYLLSQILALMDRPETVRVGDKTYHLYLRFKRTYKPYYVELVDVRKVDYIGTNTPKDYSSFVRLTVPERGVDIQKRIWMNNPLRYAGETFYQSGYDDRNGQEVTVLQVVKNRGWMIPYVGCMIVATGMLAHFSLVLLRFLKRLDTLRLSSKEEGVVMATVVAEPAAGGKGKQHKGPSGRRPPGSRRQALFGWLVPLGLVAFFGLWLVGKAAPHKTAPGQPALDQFGRLPVAYQGRVKPYDSLARNSLRVISGRETFEDTHGKRQPAIRWLLDVISGSPEAEKHPVFRIESLQVLDILQLQARSRLRYAYVELEPQMDRFQREVQLARRTAARSKERLENYQRKLLQLDDKLQLYFALRESHRMPEPDMDAMQRLGYLTRMVQHRQQMLQSPVPYGVPTDSATAPWEPLSVAATRVWVKQLARTTGKQTPADLAEYLVDQIFSDEYLKQLADEEMLDVIKAHSRRGGQQSEAELDRQARQQLAKVPAQMRERFAERKRQELEKSRPQLVRRVQEAIETAIGHSDLTDPPGAAAQGMVDILTAYRNGEVGQFNRLVRKYQQWLVEHPPAEGKLAKVSFEADYNAFAGFINCMFLYIVVFLLTVLGWLTWIIGWHRVLHRSALLLALLTFAVHTGALIGRIYISGRPPVTNLYSSAIFIGWACVALGLLLEMIFRLGFGNVVSALAGFGTMFVAWHLTGDGDTFTVLQAVLDTQFWLATHVVSITLGYAATFLAGALGTVYIFCGLVTPVVRRFGLSTPVLQWRFRNWTVGKILSTMIYGVVCFAIFFSFVGTVLGGLWADDSWGRFWGWDPKENGALIIVLWNAIVLHALWDKLVGDRGLAVLTIGGNIVTSWSWFGVNQLGIGLHSYGFTEGVLLALALYVASQLAIIGVGLLPLRVWQPAGSEEPPGEAAPA